MPAASAPAATGLDRRCNMSVGAQLKISSELPAVVIIWKPWFNGVGCGGSIARGLSLDARGLDHEIELLVVHACIIMA